MRGEIVVIRQGIAGEAVTLPSDGRFFVGRGTGCQLRFDDRGVSNVHCEFERRGEEWIVADMESRNGTFLNGKRVGAANLSQGDIVVLGATALLFRQRSGDEPESSATQVVLYPNEWRAGPDDLIESEAGMAGEARGWDGAVGAEAWRTVFSELGDALSNGATIGRGAQAALCALARATGADRGLVAIHRGHGAGWRVLATAPESCDPRGVVASEAILAKAAGLRVAILTRDALADSRLDPAETERNGTRAAICVPFETRGGASAVFYLDSPTESCPFAREHVRIARAACRVLALCPEASETASPSGLRGTGK